MSWWKKGDSVCEDVDKLEPLCTVDGNAKWCSSYENSMKFSQKVKKKKELPYDVTALFLGVYPKKLQSGSWRDTATSMFIAELFTIATTWKQLKLHWKCVIHKGEPAKKWNLFIKNYCVFILTCLNFKVLSIWCNTPIEMCFPLLKQFLNL